MFIMSTSAQLFPEIPLWQFGAIDQDMNQGSSEKRATPVNLSAQELNLEIGDSK